MKKTAPPEARGAGFAAPEPDPFVKEYSEFIRLPHRRPAYAVNAPVLTRHICRRLGRGENDPTDATTKTEYDDWEDGKIDRIDAYLRRVQLEHGVARPNLFRDADGKTPSKRDTLFATLKAGGGENYRLRLRVDLHDEYYTLTMIADGFCCRDRKRPGHDVAEILHALQKADCPRTKADVIYEHFWNRVETDEQLRLDGLPGHTFADFRGMALCPPLIAQPLVEREHTEIQLPQGELVDRRRRRQVDDVLYTFVDTRRDFFCGVYNFSAAESEAVASEDANVVMCGVLDGSAIYGSGFGKRAAETEGPLRYFVLYNGFAATQLGRLIRRFHVLGELRVAALLDIFDLRRADAEIRQLGYHADKIGTTRADEAFVEPDSGAKFRSGALFLSNRLLQIGTRCVGGLTYRVTRSRYYAQAYRERLQDLRIVRIEGWQPYDEFIRRTVFKDFDFVDRIGDRHQALNDRVARINGTEQVHEFRKNSEQTRKATDELVLLQRVADIVGAAVFTFYGAHILAECMTEFANYGAHSPAEWVKEFAKAISHCFGNPQYPSAFAYGVSLVGFVVVRIADKFLHRLARRWKAARNPPDAISV